MLSLGIAVGIVFRREWDTGQVAVWQLQEKPEDLYPLLRCEDPVYFPNQQRNLEWISVRILLQELIDGPFHLKKDAFGKPFIDRPAYHISLSHCKGYVAAQVSVSNCGIDLEPMSERILRISERFLDEHELRFLGTEPELKRLYTAWCAKEAVYKWYGRKALDFRRDMHIEPFEPELEGSLWLQLKPADVRIEVSYRIFEEHVLAWIQSPGSLQS